MSELGFGEGPAVSIVQAEGIDESESFLKGREMVTIRIDEQEGYPNYVFLQHNGDAIQVQRGVDVPVPVKYVQILKDALAHRVVQVKVPAGDGSYRMSTQLKPFHVYPWHIVAT